MMYSNDSKQVSLQTDQQIAAKAAEWLVLLDEADEALKQQFALWLALDPRHQAAVDRMQHLISNVEALATDYINNDIPKAILSQGLQSSKQPSLLSKAKPLLGGIFIVSIGLTAALQYAGLSYWLADTRNSSQSWQQEKLSDNSQIKISGKAAYNVKFDHEKRIIELIQGNILVDVAKDPQRPFIVKTAYGEIKALGTRFIISQQSQQTTLTMLESKVEVKTADLINQPYLVVGGQQIKINKNGMIEKPSVPISPKLYESAWDRQILLVNGEPLVEVLDNLSIYYEGKISFDREQLKNYRVTATLPLQNIEYTIALLSKEFNLNMETPLPLYIKITKKS